MSAVLLVATPLRLLLIDPSQLTNSESNAGFQNPPPPPPVFEVCNFLDMGLPMGMGLFVQGSTLYLVGGEIPREEVSQDDLCVKRKCAIVGLSSHVYMSEMTSVESITSFRNFSADMLSAKHNALVTSIEGRIYVLSRAAYLYDDDYMVSPLFEAFDPSTNEWEALPSPPCRSVYKISAAGTTIFVRGGSDFYRYDVNTRVWDSLGSSVIDMDVHPLLLPDTQSDFVAEYEDLLVGFHGSKPFAALIPDSGTTIYQSLAELFDLYYDKNILSDSGMVFSIGQKEMCIIKVGVGVDGGDVLAYITTFRVEMLHSPEIAFQIAQDSSISIPSFHDFFDANWDDSSLAPFVEVTCLTKGWYCLEEWGKDMPFICGAFYYRFMRSKRDRDPSDSSSRKRLRLMTSSKRERELDSCDPDSTMKRQKGGS